MGASIYTKRDLREAAVRSIGARHQMVLPEGKPMRTRATKTTKSHNTTTKKGIRIDMKSIRPMAILNRLPELS